eukprot:NODE_1163_length_1070_cov_7.823702_g899_i0.p4 GENE.NODE_1163_length_1070_cov_7.823702_g899_i0~~NODE_1163_length_1070_cov_7.823702_g899_i0.p4  ORF type:complete len:85 (+),score=13.67 NODE_1163_length_1070_cov_7.823702_g899_i0:362-616(+)
MGSNWSRKTVNVEWLDFKKGPMQLSRIAGGCAGDCDIPSIIEIRPELEAGLQRLDVGEFKFCPVTFNRQLLKSNHWFPAEDSML